ncbi:MAG: hypothetical protein HKN15_00045 [Xanthomonadales bacterium]|nr:hypothetical protein [Xanthomonadales bacterium]
MPSITPDIEGTYQVSLAVSDPLGPGALTDSVEITATLAEEFAETRIVEADTVIDSLPPEDVTTRGNANALKQFLRQAAAALMRGDVDKAIDSLEKAIERTDGCPLRGSPDTDGMERDWITDCAAQQELYELLVDALAALGS